MRTRICAGLLAGSLLAVPVAGQTPSAAAPVTTPEAEAIRGPRLGSPEVYKVGPGSSGVLSPKLLKDVKPSYTEEAMRAKVQGIVRMACVVLTDGTVGEVKVTKSLEPGLDKRATATLRQWTFKPGTLAGDPVPVAIQVEMSFKLK